MKSMNQDQKLEEKYEGMIPDALIFAFNAHSGQYRKTHSQPYIIHPLRVSEFLLKNFSDHEQLEAMRLAAILHDTIEDTWVTKEDIESHFGKKVAELVCSLTKPDVDDRQKRTQSYIVILQEGSDEAKIVKLADIFDNVILSTDDSPRWQEFLEYCETLLKSMSLKEKNSRFEKIKTELLNAIEHKLNHNGQNTKK